MPAADNAFLIRVDNRDVFDRRVVPKFWCRIEHVRYPFSTSHAAIHAATAAIAVRIIIDQNRRALDIRAEVSFSFSQSNASF
jgi:hypothetical protein